MKTLSPSILAMYLGCDCQYIDEDFNELILPLLAVNMSGYAWFVDPEFDEAIEIKNVKPILRNLSSMTEEETIASELGCYDYRGVIVYYDPMFPHSEQFSPDQFAYLLSKSFDVFNLIEDGVAIDRDSINETI